MLPPQLPEQIAPYKLARQGISLQGTISVAEMGRLAELLTDSQGAVEVELHFGIDEQGVRYVRGRLIAQVNVECQRCMQPMPITVEGDISVGFVASDDMANNLPETYEPCVVADDTVVLSDLVEDELILALPIVSVHPDQACQPWFEQEGNQPVEEAPVEEKKNPFAVLEALKKGK